jgi:hypothetical protein
MHSMPSKLPSHSERISVHSSDRGPNSFARLLLGLAAAGNCFGCSADSNESLVNMQTHVGALSGALESSSVVDVEAESGNAAVMGGILISKSDMPSPGRSNAFELLGEFHADASHQESGGKREVYVLGFVEVDEPSVMLSIDGRTEVLKNGDTFERITVQEIVPPRAKLFCDGVSWSASIFDRRNPANEALTRKKSN